MLVRAGALLEYKQWHTYSDADSTVMEITTVKAGPMTNNLHHALCLVVLFAFYTTVAADEPLPDAAEKALQRAVEFYHQKVSSHGGYVYLYSADLAKREGEGVAGQDKVWVQPPGTPSVGLAYLDAHERTGDVYLLDAAKAAGECLVRGQLHSGGWTASIELAPEARKKCAYCVDGAPRKRAFNVTSFDDDKTQSAMRFLMRLDKALQFHDERIHESITFALDSVLKAQFPNGAWAQGYSEFPDPTDGKYPIQSASFPDQWPREHPGSVAAVHRNGEP